MTFEEIIHEIRAMPAEQRKTLVNVIFDSLTEKEPIKLYSILEFEGAGAHVRDEIDPQDYVNQLRSEWDERP
jgi:hypothetical protein